MQIRKVTVSELDGVLALIDQFDRPVSPRPSDTALMQIFGSIVQLGKAVLRFAQDFAQEAGRYKVALMTGSNKPETLKF